MRRHNQSGFTEFVPSSMPVADDQHARVALRAMGRAVSQDRLRFVYQPVVKAAQPSFPAFYECLLRIEEPSGHLASVGQFMPLIEQHELGRIVDRIALRRALSALKTHPECRLSVNVSAQSLGDMEWMHILHQAADEPERVSDRMIVEITESSELVADEISANFFDQIRSAGCSVAVDDFGAGYTSLAQLRDFRFDMLKIDGSFVRGLRKHSVNRFMVEKMIEIAKHLDLLVIAEWVETADEAEILAQMGADCLQGFHFGKPLTELPGRAPGSEEPLGRISL